MRVRTFSLIWIGLFAATIGAHRIYASHRTRASNSVELIESVMRNVAKVRLDFTPRKTTAIATPTEPTDRAFEDAMRAFLEDKRDQLRICGRPIMNRSTIPTEYFELSFVVRGASGPGGVEARLDDIVVERTTIPLEPDDESCLVKLFGGFVIPMDGALPTSRTSYQLCFSHQI